MIFTGRSVDALDQVGGVDVGVVGVADDNGRKDVSAISIAASWFSSLRRPRRKNNKTCQKHAKSAWDLTAFSTVGQ